MASLNLKHIRICDGSYPPAQLVAKELTLGNVVVAVGVTWQAANMLPNLSNVVTVLADRELLRVEVLGS